MNEVGLIVLIGSCTDSYGIKLCNLKNDDPRELYLVQRDIKQLCSKGRLCSLYISKTNQYSL